MKYTREHETFIYLCVMIQHFRILKLMNNYFILPIIPTYKQVQLNYIYIYIYILILDI